MKVTFSSSICCNSYIRAFANRPNQYVTERMQNICYMSTSECPDWGCPTSIYPELWPELLFQSFFATFLLARSIEPWLHSFSSLSDQEYIYSF